MCDISMCHYFGGGGCGEGEGSHETVPINYNFRGERQAKADSNLIRLPASLAPHHKAKAARGTKRMVKRKRSVGQVILTIINNYSHLCCLP